MEHGALVTPDGNVIKWQDVPQPQTPNTLPNEITQLCTKVTLTRQPLAIGQAKGAETICGVGFNFCRPYTLPDNEPLEAGPFRIIGFLPEVLELEREARCSICVSVCCCFILLCALVH